MHGNDLLTCSQCSAHSLVLVRADNQLLEPSKKAEAGIYVFSDVAGCCPDHELGACTECLTEFGVEEMRIPNRSFCFGLDEPNAAPDLLDLWIVTLDLRCSSVCNGPRPPHVTKCKVLEKIHRLVCDHGRLGFPWD